MTEALLYARLVKGQTRRCYWINAPDKQGSAVAIAIAASQHMEKQG